MKAIVNNLLTINTFSSLEIIKKNKNKNADGALREV